MKAKFTIAMVSLLSLGIEKAQSQEQVPAARDFQDWSVFIDGGDCWVSSYLDSQMANDRENFHYLVTFYKDEAKPRISIVSGSEVFIREVILLTIGSERFIFSVFDGYAYPLNDDEMVIFNRMLSADPLEIVFNDDLNNILTANLSYAGFRDALDYISHACNINIDQSIFNSNGISVALRDN